MSVRILSIATAVSLLFACAAAPDAEPAMSGSRWSLETASEPFSALAPSSGITLEFEVDRLAGHGGCNRYGASYTLQGTTLTVGPTVATKRACGGAADAIERAWFDLLSSPLQLTRSGDVLTLENETGTAFRFARVTR
jgi:heat shock protein HslJ